MLTNILTKIFGNKHERDIKKIESFVVEINRSYAELRQLGDDELRAKTFQFRDRIHEHTKEIRQQIRETQFRLIDPEANDHETAGENLHEKLKALKEEENKQTEDVLMEILPEAFATVKETCRRLMGIRWEITDIETEWYLIPYDVQLLGGVVLHNGKIAEMATGEGKTLVASLAIYLNALTGKGVHLITVNDYLAQRDSEWMGKIYNFHGLTVSAITNDMEPYERKSLYAADIVYGTNNEFGFDYLRDNMAQAKEHRVQRGHHYAIIDEVDSVLIDEARTPLIISGPVEHATTNAYGQLKPNIERLVRNQTLLVNRLIADAQKLTDSGEEDEATYKLLQAQRGAPKNRRLMKLLQERGIKRSIQMLENDLMRDKKLHEVDEDLFFAIDEKSHVIDLTEKGRAALSPHDPKLFVLPDLSQELHEIETDETFAIDEDDPAEEKQRKAELKSQKIDEVNRNYAEKSENLRNIEQLLKAYTLFEKDVDYVVSDGSVLIVDEFTGRILPGRRYSDGLHQALEAKEGVKIERETQTWATITLQNYFRLYSKLAGMTGTAETEANEFWEIYKLDVTVIPTNEPIRRIDYEDKIYRTKREKFNAVLAEIERLNKAKLPVLVGTISVEVSETLSRMLTRQKIKHSVLNAKQHQKEAEIVMNAGQPGQVTIATNMAGRGTDIKLGQGVISCEGKCYLVDTEDRAVPSTLDLEACKQSVPCGLQIIGTERHESRRIDRQLRGRSGRQGDPGASRFYLSLEDDLMRLFGSERIASVMDRLGVEEGEVIEHSMITKSIERAQKRVEMRNFDIRKHLLEYDNVMNLQRTNIYSRRNQALEGENLREEIIDIIHQFISNQVNDITADFEDPLDWNLNLLRESIQLVIPIPPPITEEEIPNLDRQELIERITRQAELAYEEKEKYLSKQLMRRLERYAYLKIIDIHWRDHLFEMDLIREGINLRAYGQKDPLLEYKSEAFKLFSQMQENIDRDVITEIFKTSSEFIQERDAVRTERRKSQRAMQMIHQSTDGMGLAGQSSEKSEQQPRKPQPVKTSAKIGRNAPCPCGSGKKYKNCCGM
ncbi:preprotein translocase subunit SecA [candidate division KSB1 bacterium]|nr:preprotein translocase subunit SecA [candidate division KSB1 bacterium]